MALLKRDVRSEKTGSIVGSDATWEGTIETSSSLRIDGRMKGSVKAGGDIVIGENAQVEGDLQGNSILIAGFVQGEIKAVEKLELTSKGKLYGNFQAEKLLVEEGAILRGECRMDLEGLSTEAPVAPVKAEAKNETKTGK